jgi:hypothetical protein
MQTSATERITRVMIIGGEWFACKVRSKANSRESLTWFPSEDDDAIKCSWTGREGGGQEKEEESEETSLCGFVRMKPRSKVNR